MENSGFAPSATSEEQRESFRQDTFAAWLDYQETGRHVTGDEVVAWLDTWGNEHEQTSPSIKGRE